MGPSSEPVDRTGSCISLAHQQKEHVSKFHLLLHFCIWAEFITSFRLCSNFKNDGICPGGMVCLV